MKRVITGIIVFAILPLAGISQKNKIAFPLSEKKIPLSSFNQLTIDGNFKLTLVENDEPAIEIKGNTRFIKAFKFYQRQETLLVRNTYADESVNNEVILHVKNLRKIIVKAQSEIFTEGILQSESLNILINAECFIKINNKGITRVTASEDFILESL